MTMALPEETKLTTSTTVKSTVNSHSQKQEKREKPLTKVVIRRLPPAIDKETFMNQISPVPNYDYFYLVNGEAALGENSFARAYINFLNSNDVFDFKEKFDNYVFLDHKGIEYAAVVEFAAFQKIPKKRNKARIDPKCGSIESDPYYLEFIENLNKPVEQEDKPEYSYQFLTETSSNKDMVSTPLLDFVKNRRVERMRIREERREERRRKELERKKIRDEERKKRFEEKSPTKVFTKTKMEERDVSDTEVKEEKREGGENKSEKHFEKSTSFKNKEKKFEDRKKEMKVKPSPRKEYPEKREFKGRKEHFKESYKFDSYKKEEKQFPKKVKKYSERREERKMEAQKAELRKAEEQDNKSGNAVLSTKKEDIKENELEEKVAKDPIKAENVPGKNELEENNDKIQPISEKESTSNQNKQDNKPDKPETTQRAQKQKRLSHHEYDKDNRKDSSFKSSGKDLESKSGETKESRRERIRNKDRPTIAIYRPGMLSRRKLAEDVEKEPSKEASKETK